MKVLKYLFYIVGGIIVLVAIAGLYVKTALPDTGPAPEMTIERTSERVERGKYLANHVTLCMDCHSARDWTRYSGPMDTTAIGGGGEEFTREMGFPGNFYAPNITPYRLTDWTDGEIFRAVTTGVSKDGKALFPMMGYHRFGKMDEEDIKSIIAYVRTLAPVKTEIPASKADFPFSFIINTLPEKAAFSPIPSRDDKLAYGKYIVNAAGCVECHSQREKGEIVPGTEFGGGMEFPQPNGIMRSVNITMDKETGIGNWSKDAFVRKFRMYADSSYVPHKLGADELNTPMPWTMYGQMKEEDLEAIYDHLTSVAPLKNAVVKIEKKK